MKKIFISICCCAILMVSSCGKDFLNVTPIDDLSGNNYWKTERDAEQFLIGIYSTFRDATMGRIFFPATGDLRCAPINRTSATSGEGRDYLTYLKFNLLNATLGQRFEYFGFDGITKWNTFYKMVQLSNIVIYEMDQLEPGILSEAKKKQFQAEASFLRNLAYFFMVRLYGDIPYYTEAYHSQAIGRTDMVEVLQKCIEDMKLHYKDLPWTYEDPSLIGNRTMRGSAIALMMHMNMWIAGFTDADKNPYYRDVEALGKEIMEENGGAYELLPLERTKEIFKGRTKEGLFEITQNLNYGETFHLSAPFSDYVLRFPNKVTTRSYIYYDTKFMEELYPMSAKDSRKDIWFDENIYNTTGLMQMLKFSNIFMEEGEDYNPDDNQVVFRYADAILLRAEALAELGLDGQARQMVNIIRDRAKADPAISEAGDELKDFIWWERTRELMGEGHFFYDLVRTKKVINSKYTSSPINVEAFNKGAWTWPIDRSALKNNPYMTLNSYWN